MSVNQFEIEESHAAAVVQKYAALEKQFIELQEAGQKRIAAEEALEQLRERIAKAKVDAFEHAVIRITDMSFTVTGDPRDGLRPLATVNVCITSEDAVQITRCMHHLNHVESTALLRHWWKDVPAHIRALADTPEAAYKRYVAGKHRGFLTS